MVEQPQPQPQPTVRHGLVAVGGYGLCFAAGLAATLGWLALVIERTQEFPPFAPFGGWQLYAVETALGLLAASLAAIALWRLVRSYRRLRDRTPHRRAVVLAVLLPGLMAGSLAASPMRSAFSVASAHTAAAAAARHRYEAWLKAYRKAPAAAPTSRPAAPPWLSAPLLQRADLGANWFDMMAPNPAQLPIHADVIGEVAAANSMLTEQRWDGQSWRGDVFFTEFERVFGSGAQARAYLPHWIHPAMPATCNGCTFTDTVSHRRIGGVVVTELSGAGSTGITNSAFIVGRTFFTVRANGSRVRPDVTERILKAAIAKAEAHRPTVSG